MDAGLPVILLGETGTGKELIARAIHGISPVREGPFVAVNCATLPHGLEEAELFGYERGAFTGAERTKQGLIEFAKGGSLFLDEVHALPLPAQSMLLRALEPVGGSIRRVGGNTEIPTRLRLLCATSRDLGELIEPRQEGKQQFLPDLYARISGAVIQVPSLNQRVEDISVLAKRFLDEFCRENGHLPITVTDNAKDALVRHHWRFNIRELRNTMRRTALKVRGTELTAEDLEFDPLAHGKAKAFPEPSDRPPSGDMVRRIMLAAPARQGPQRRIWELLFEAWPASVSLKHLLQVIEGSDADPDNALTHLQIKISQLRQRLRGQGLAIDFDSGTQEYRLAELPYRHLDGLPVDT